MIRFSCSLRRGLVLALFVLMFASSAVAQEFQILRAQYGSGDRWVDVTPRLRDLARADRAFQVSNDTFGVDPAPGQAKVLRIEARGPRGEARTFDYREGGTVDGAEFADSNGGARARSGRDLAAGPYQLLRGEYGSGDRWVDVTPQLRDLARADRAFQVSNGTFGVDPAPGQAKMLRIEARGPRGESRTFDYREGGTVDGAQFADSNGGGRNGTGRRDVGQLNIITAVYGASNRSTDVAARLQSLVRDNRLYLIVSNVTLNIDPAPGAQKSLLVAYSIGGGPQRELVVSEGQQLTIP